MAVHLNAGDNPSVAARKAGFPETVVRTRAAKIARGESVKAALLELAAGLKPGELGNLGKARVYEFLSDSEKVAEDPKTALGYARTAGEWDGMLGGPSELHLHQHATLPPTVQKMLEDKMREILALKGDTIDGTIVSERAGSQGQSQENHDGVQIGELTHRFQDRAIG